MSRISRQTESIHCPSFFQILSASHSLHTCCWVETWIFHGGPSIIIIRWTLSVYMYEYPAPCNRFRREDPAKGALFSWDADPLFIHSFIHTHAHSFRWTFSLCVYDSLVQQTNTHSTSRNFSTSPVLPTLTADRNSRKFSIRDKNTAEIITFLVWWEWLDGKIVQTWSEQTHVNMSCGSCILFMLKSDHFFAADSLLFGIIQSFNCHNFLIIGDHSQNHSVWIIFSPRVSMFEPTSN